MMKKFRWIYIVKWLMIVLCLFLLACATTPKQKQLLTIETFNGIYKQYLDVYDRQPENIKAEWKKDIDPYWQEASTAIDAYMAISDPASTEAQKKIAIYNAAKNHAIKLLLKYGIKIKED